MKNRLAPAYLKFTSFILAAALAWLNTSSVAFAQSQPPARTAEDVYLEMLSSYLLQTDSQQTVAGTDGKFTYGAEKEASSSLLTRVMGPNREEFKLYISQLSPENQVLFLRDFLSGWIRGSYRVRGVKDVNGVDKDFTFNEAGNDKIADLSADELHAKFNRWLELAGDRSFSFVAPGIRRKIFNGELKGQTGKPFGVNKRNQASSQFSRWTANYGEPEKYIRDAHNTSVGWEINFHPMQNYTDFEAQRNWFVKALSNAGEDFGSFGHQRLVFPKRFVNDPVKKAKSEQKLAEIYKNVQAYILLRSQEGASGVELANYKSIITDKTFLDMGNGQRGILRLETDRFGANTYAVEMRAGTKTDSTRRMAHASLVSRYSTGDYSNLADSSSWTLFDDTTVSESELVRRFGLPRDVVRRALENITTPSKSAGELRGDRRVNEQYLIPFWRWENAPYLSRSKKAMLKELSRSLLIAASEWNKPAVSDIQQALMTWAQASNLTRDISKYLAPKSSVDQQLQDLMEFHPKQASRVDVNTIDLGIEYSARFPIKLKGDYAKGAIKSGQGNGWLRTEYDLSDDEREATLKNVATDLARALGGKVSEVTRLTESGHGNSLSKAYEFKDGQGRKLRVEWDGIGRDYDSDGTLVPHSARGGHVELVTPKFNPTAKEVTAIYRTFNKFNLIPLARAGGGHINIDLSPFQGNPAALARFLSVFHANRGIIALMFQHPERLRSAEPTDVSTTLSQQLRNFHGTEAELKALLYNSRYFNTRVGRKTRYSQLDLSAYFQDVIPENLIHEDFDIKNDVWRENFRVDPNVRKAEFRLFDAPKDEVESALQIKLVRAMLNYALNPNQKQQPGDVQPVSYEAYAQHPQQAFNDIQKLATDLGLDAELYRRYVVDGLITSEAYVKSKNYQSLSERLRENPKQEKGWNQAVEPRSAEHAVASAGRPSVEVTQPSQEAIDLAEARRTDALKMDALRSTVKPSDLLNGSISRETLAERLDKITALSNRSHVPDDDALMIIYRNLGGPKDKKAKAALNRISQSPVRLEQAIGLAISQPNQAFQAWLLSLLNKGRVYHDLDSTLIVSNDPALRRFALENMKALSTEQFMSKLYWLQYSEAAAIDVLKEINRRDISRLSSSTRDELTSWLTRLMQAHSKNPVVLNDALKLQSRLGIEKSEYGVSSLLYGLDNSYELAKRVFKKYLKHPQVDRKPVIAAALASPNADIRKDAWKAAARDLIQPLLDPNSKSRADAYENLDKIYDRDFTVRIVLASNADQSKYEAVAQDALKYLATHAGASPSSSAKIAEKLKSAFLKTHDVNFRKTLIKGLGQGSGAAFDDAIKELLTNQSVDVRRTASLALLIPSYEITRFRLALQFSADAEPEIRDHVNLALTTSTSPASLVALFEGESSGDPDQKRMANRLLVEKSKDHGFDELMGGLIQSLPYSEYGQYAGRILQVLESPNFKPTPNIMRAALYSDRPAFRDYFVKREHQISDEDFVTATSNFGYYDAAATLKVLIKSVQERKFKDRKTSIAAYENSTLYSLSYTDDESVRNAVAPILKEVLLHKENGADVATTLEGLLMNGRPEVRKITAAMVVDLIHRPEVLRLAFRYRHNPEVGKVLTEGLRGARQKILRRSCEALF